MQMLTRVPHRKQEQQPSVDLHLIPPLPSLELLTERGEGGGGTGRWLRGRVELDALITSSPTAARPVITLKPTQEQTKEHGQRSALGLGAELGEQGTRFKGRLLEMMMH